MFHILLNAQSQTTCLLAANINKSTLVSQTILGKAKISCILMLEMPLIILMDNESPRTRNCPITNEINTRNCPMTNEINTIVMHAITF